MNFIMIYHFLPERMKIEKFEKLVANLHDKTENVTHMRNLRQALYHGLVLKKKCIKQNTWLKSYIDILMQFLEKLWKM